MDMVVDPKTNQVYLRSGVHACTAKVKCTQEFCDRYSYCPLADGDYSKNRAWGPTTGARVRDEYSDVVLECLSVKETDNDRIWRDYDGRSRVCSICYLDIEIGDWVSSHDGNVCHSSCKRTELDPARQD